MLGSRRREARKTLAGAYSWWFLGLLLAILGFHRFYLRQHIAGIVFSVPLLTGIFMIIYQYTKIIYGTLSAATNMLSGLNSGGIGTGAGSLNLETIINYDYIYIGGALAGLGVVVWLIEGIRLPALFRAYEAEHNRSDSVDAEELIRNFGNISGSGGNNLRGKNTPGTYRRK